ncbi:MAG: S8 family serine peptidase, partial [Gammaproteobacteria bacterium]|nr:S8 family serine peptidase [Gammaproteobacteria bacterium]
IEAFLINRGVIYSPLFDEYRGDFGLKKELGMSRTYLIEAANDIDPETLRQELLAYDPNSVEVCIHNQRLYFDKMPDDTFFKEGEQENLRTIGMDESFWTDLLSNSIASGVVLALIDTPVDVTHEDMQENILPDTCTGVCIQFDSNENCIRVACEDNLPEMSCRRATRLPSNGQEERFECERLLHKDCTRVRCIEFDSNGKCTRFACENFELAAPIRNPHGTQIAGIAAAVTDNGRGIAGVAGTTQLMPLAVGKEDYAKFDAVFRALEYAVDEKLDNPQYNAMVLNMSLSASLFDFGNDPQLREDTVKTLHRWIRYAHQSGVPIVTSMGNRNSGISHYPAAYPETIAVGAIHNNGYRWDDGSGRGSNYGPHNDLVAPGSDIFSTVPMDSGFDGYDFNTGTSMAVPHVTGAAGLQMQKLLAVNPGYSVTQGTIEELRWMLKETAGSYPEPLPSEDQAILSQYGGNKEYLYGAGMLNVAGAVSYTATDQHLEVGPASYHVGEMHPGGVSVIPITISNPCGRPVEFTQGEIQIIPLSSFGGKIEPSDPEFSEFSILENQCNGVLDSEPCQIQVQFTPNTEGFKQAKLRIPASFFLCSADPSPSSEGTTLDVLLTATVTDTCPDDPDKVEPGMCGCGNPDTDSDNDGTPDCYDNCRNTPNADQVDSDGDDVGNACDPCSNDPNKTEPGVCGCGVPDTDSDNDNIPDCIDNCPSVPNPNQKNTDLDGLGDACDLDDDNDGVPDGADNCSLISNPTQEDTDLDGLGDTCDPDDDNDEVLDGDDNCPLTSN